MKEILVTEKGNVLKDNVFSFDERRKQLEEMDAQEQARLKREKNSPFSRWVQFNLERTKELMWLTLNHPKARVILDFLVDNMDEYNAVMCSYKVLQELLNVTGETIRKNIKVLKENGFVAILKSGSSNVYAINDTICWKSWGNNLRYSKFPANVVLALSEQDKEYQAHFKNLQTTKHKEVSAKDEQ